MRALSVIVAARNAEGYIDRCVTSILSQGVDAEVLVLDDGSTDRTRERLARYGGQITVISLPQTGGSVSAARNLGLDRARGELITFCDADDWYPPGALARVLALQRETDADIVRFSYRLAFPNGQTCPARDEGFTPGLVEKEAFPQAIYPHFICGIALNSVWGAVFKRAVAVPCRFPVPLATAEDAVFSIQAYTAARRVLLCPEALYCYYQRPGSLTGNGVCPLQKYRCNRFLARRTLELLPLWGMDTPAWRLKTVLRPLRLTVSKLRRMGLRAVLAGGAG